MEVLLFIAFGVAALCVIAYIGMDTENLFVLLVGVFSLFGAGAGALILVLASWEWLASSHKADLINRQLGTSYTKEDIFYASGYIEEVREMHRKRIELNGNLITGKEQ